MSRDPSEAREWRETRLYAADLRKEQLTAQVTTEEILPLEEPDPPWSFDDHIAALTARIEDLEGQLERRGRRTRR